MKKKFNVITKFLYQITKIGLKEKKSYNHFKATKGRNGKDFSLGEVQRENKPAQNACLEIKLSSHDPTSRKR